VGTVVRAPATGNGPWAWSHNDLAFGRHRPGRIVFLENQDPGRLVSKFAILVIDFVTAFFNLGVKKTAWWMIKYPRIKKNAR
jgi:hypothetical protein